MAAPARKSSSVITHRAKATIALPAMTLGYSNLIEPETFDADKPKLTMNGHLTPAGIQALIKVVQEKVYTPAALEALIAECTENKIKAGATQDAATWLEGKLKEPKDTFPIQLPFIKLENNQLYNKWVDGEKTVQKRTIQAWDGHNKKLNLKRLLLGRGSVIEPVVFPNLYFSKLAGVIAPSLKLVGIRVIELVQFAGGGSNAPDETSQEDIANILGRDVDAQDLSRFMGGDDEPDDDDDEGHPVKAPSDASPADKAKGMF